MTRRFQATGVLIGLLLLTVALAGIPRAAVTGFNSPFDVAVSPMLNYYYVTNSGNNTVSIVAASTNSIAGTITGFDIPAGAAITKNGTFAYVTDLGSNELSRITTATNSITDITGGFDRPYFVSLSPDGKTGYVTNQGNDTVSIVNLTSHSGLSAPTIAPPSATFDADQNVTLAGAWHGGAPPYSSGWTTYQGPSAVYSASHTGLYLLYDTFSLPASTLGVGNYEANVVVSDATAQTSNSVKSAFSINPALVAGNPSPQSPTISSGQSVTLTANPSGGTLPYSYLWHVSLTPACNSGSVAVGTGASISVSPSSSTYYCYSVTDNATTPSSKASGADLVSVTSPTPPPPQPGTGGGGAAGAGQQKPTVITTTSNSTSVIVNLLAEQTTLNITSPVPSQNEGVVLGIAAPNSFNLTLHGERLNFTTNYISPQDAGMTINGNSYVLPLNGSVVINETRGYNYTLSVQLVNVSLQPILHTVSVMVSAKPNPINITAQNSTTDIPANQTLTVRNLTSSGLVPTLPPGYEKQLIQSLNVTRKPNESRINTTVYTQIKYNCSIPFYQEVPLVLSSRSWAQVSSFTVTPKDCIVTLSFGSDPVLALAKKQSSPNSTVTTTIPASVAPTTTVPLATLVQEGAGNFLEAIFGIALAMIIVAIILEHHRHRKGLPPSIPHPKHGEPLPAPWSHTGTPDQPPQPSGAPPPAEPPMPPPQPPPPPPQAL